MMYSLELLILNTVPTTVVCFQSDPNIKYFSRKLKKNKILYK